MKLSSKVEEVLNKQINAEFWSAHLYLSMAAYFENKGFKGFAHWMKIQYREEVSHALKLFDYVNERGGRVLLEAVAEVEVDWNGVYEVFEDTYAHECKVTEMIYNCMDVAVEAGDYATSGMLQWYVDEQIEEEATVQDLLNRLKLIGSDGSALYMLEKELSARVFTEPGN